eukprot:6183000-Pyramimonas_sp.AAC.1
MCAIPELGPPYCCPSLTHIRVLAGCRKEWGVYHKYNGGPSLRRRQAEGAECPAGEALCPSVPS